MNSKDIARYQYDSPATRRNFMAMIISGYIVPIFIVVFLIPLSLEMMGVDMSFIGYDVISIKHWVTHKVPLMIHYINFDFFENWLIIFFAIIATALLGFYMLCTANGRLYK